MRIRKFDTLEKVAALKKVLAQQKGKGPAEHPVKKVKTMKTKHEPVRFVQLSLRLGTPLADEAGAPCFEKKPKGD